MCVWQSHASAGTSKFTLVAGCDAVALPQRGSNSAPAAAAPNTNSRRPIMTTSLVEGLSYQQGDTLGIRFGRCASRERPPAATPQDWDKGLGISPRRRAGQD